MTLDDLAIQIETLRREVVRCAETGEMVSTTMALEAREVYIALDRAWRGEPLRSSHDGYRPKS